MISRLENDIAGYDLCIIGSGPAGLAIAAELAYTGLRLCVLESGTDRRSAHADSLKEVVSEKLSIKENSRERVMGGASSAWGGLSAPLDETDLRHWPISSSELGRYLKRAAERYRFPSSSAFRSLPHGWEFEGLQDKTFVAVRPPYQFASVRPIFSRNGVDLFFDATVVALSSKPSGTERMVSEAVCRSRDGATRSVRARIFVLAAGGIENPRLLLNSSLGNEHDQVGRYFMNHPKGYAGFLRLRKPLPAASPYLPRTIDGRMTYAGLRLSDDIQIEQDLLNSCIQFEADPAPMARYTFALWRRLPRSVSRMLGFLRPRRLRLRWFADMESRSENRVSIGEKRDRFGIPVPVVRYELGEKDKETLRTLHKKFSEEIERRGVGVLEGNAEEVFEAVVQDASHHLGATRMGTDPRFSVVDADCRLHNVHNFYLAGGSVFPSGGCANPTLTITALAIRLADFLKKTLDVAGHPDIAVPTGKEIIIVGAGKRVSTDVLPALESLEKHFSVRSIYASHPSTLFGTRRIYAVESMDSLANEDLSNVQFVYLAVPTTSVEAALKRLAHLSPRAELIIDTPAPRSKKLRRRLAAFVRVHVAEDSVCLPWLPLLNDRLVRGVECEHSVYRYHGIALIKAIAHAPVRLAWRWNRRLYVQAGALNASIIEPRDYAHGKLFLDGSEISMLLEKNRCVGFALGATRTTLPLEESHLAGFMDEDDTIVSRMPEIKRIGLYRLLKLIVEGAMPVPLSEGLNDVHVDHALHRFWIYRRLK